jgi:hypothetical protein
MAHISKVSLSTYLFLLVKIIFSQFAIQLKEKFKRIKMHLMKIRKKKLRKLPPVTLKSAIIR